MECRLAIVNKDRAAVVRSAIDKEVGEATGSGSDLFSSLVGDRLVRHYPSSRFPN